MQPAAYLFDSLHQQITKGRIEDFHLKNRHGLPFRASEIERTMIAISYRGKRPSRPPWTFRERARQGPLPSWLTEAIHRQRMGQPRALPMSHFAARYNAWTLPMYIFFQPSAFKRSPLLGSSSTRKISPLGCMAEDARLSRTRAQPLGVRRTA